MAKSIDDLLNAIKQEYQSNASGSNTSGDSPSSPSPVPASSSPSSNLPQKSVDDLLADIGMGSPSSSPPSKRPPFPSVRSSASPTPAPSSTPVPSPRFPTVWSSPSSSPSSVPASGLAQAKATPSNSAQTHKILAQVKSEYDADQAAQEKVRQAALEAERLRQRQLEEQARQEQQIEAERQRHLVEQRLAARRNYAQEWLNQLDPNSDEGFWFESFAGNYSEKLDAALDYLDALDKAE